MKTKASAGKTATAEDEAEPKKIRSSRSKRRGGHRDRSSSSGSESPRHKRSKKHSKRIADKKSKRSKFSSRSRRHHRHSLSPSHSFSSSSSPYLLARHSLPTCSSSSSSSASERLVSPPPRSRSRDVRKKKGRGRDKERDHKRRKIRRSASSSSTSASSGSSRSRSRSKSKHRKQRTVAGTTRDKIEIDHDNRHVSLSDKKLAEDDHRDKEAIATIAKKGDDDTDRYKNNLELVSPASKNANETQEMAPAGGGNSDAEDLELILRQKALENFRKFRAAAVMASKTDTNGTTGKEALIDGLQNVSTEIAEVRSAAVSHFQRQRGSLVMKTPAGSPRSEDCGNGTGHSWKQDGSAGMRRGPASPGRLEAGDTGASTQQKGRMVEATHSNCQFRSPQDGRNSCSVMQRLVSTPGSCASVNQRLGSSAGVSHVNGAPRIRSVVSIPAREGLDGSTTPPRPSENSAPVENSGNVGHPLIDINKSERSNGDDTKTSEASTSNGSILSPAEGKSQVRTEDKDGAQFQKKTFSRMHDGEMVEVSYKVYIPKKTPALARRKLQR